MEDEGLDGRRSQYRRLPDQDPFFGSFGVNNIIVCHFLRSKESEESTFDSIWQQCQLLWEAPLELTQEQAFYRHLIK